MGMPYLLVHVQNNKNKRKDLSATIGEKVLFEVQQVAWNMAVWGSLPAAIELFVKSDGGGPTAFTVAVAAIEQLIENRVVDCVPPKARRYVPLAVTTTVMTGALLCLENATRHLDKVACIAAVTSLSFAFIKSMTNRPYPDIVPVAKHVAARLPIIGSFFQEKSKLF